MPGENIPNINKEHYWSIEEFHKGIDKLLTFWNDNENSDMSFSDESLAEKLKMNVLFVFRILVQLQTEKLVEYDDKDKKYHLTEKGKLWKNTK